MKKFVFWAMMTLGVVGLQSCDKDDDDRLQVSVNLQEAFDTRYPNVSRVDWEQNGQFYEAEFADNGYENKAWFTPDGVWVMTEYDIPFAQLPQAVQDAFKTGAYASWRVDDVDKIEKTDASVIYVISKFPRQSAVACPNNSTNARFICNGSTTLEGRNCVFTLCSGFFNDTRILINSGVGGFRLK